MMNEEELRRRLRKIEAIFERPGTDGERNAAEAALNRIKAQLADIMKAKAIEYTFTLSDRWSRKLFMALCRRYDLKPYRYPRQRYTTVRLRAPQSFVDDILWPQYQALHKELTEYLEQATSKIIAEEVHGDTSEAPEMTQFLESGTAQKMDD